MFGVALNDGSGSFSSVQALPDIYPNALTFDVSDLNSDGILDLVLLYGAGSQTISWCAGIGDGAFGPSQTIPIATLNAGDVFARDMNGDGIADLVTRQDLYTVLWLAGAGNGTFTLGGTVTAPQVFAR